MGAAPNSMLYLSFDLGAYKLLCVRNTAKAKKLKTMTSSWSDLRKLSTGNVVHVTMFRLSLRSMSLARFTIIDFTSSSLSCMEKRSANSKKSSVILTYPRADTARAFVDGNQTEARWSLPHARTTLALNLVAHIVAYDVLHLSVKILR